MKEECEIMGDGGGTHAGIYSVNMRLLEDINA